MDRESFLRKSGIKPPQPVTIDGEIVCYVRTLPFGEVRKLYDDPDNMDARLIVLSACDEQGTAILKDEDVSAVQAADGGVMQRVWLEASRVNGLTGSIEDAEKN